MIRGEAGLVTSKGKHIESEGQRFARELYVKHYSLITNIVMGIVHNRYAVEDIIHDAFLEVRKRYVKMLAMGMEGAAAYLVTIVKSRAYDYLRKENRMIPMEDAFLLSQGDGIDNTSEAALLKLSYEQAGELVEKLSDQLKLVFILRYYYEENDAEIARIAGIGVNTVHVYLYRAKQELKKLAAKEGYLI